MFDPEIIQMVLKAGAAVSIAYGAGLALFKIIKMMHDSHREDVSNLIEKIDEISEKDRRVHREISDKVIVSQKEQTRVICSSIDSLTKAINRGESLIESHVQN